MLALGLAPVFTLAADLMVSTAPPERAGAAAGISETSSEFGGALGIAVLFTQALQLAASLSATVVIAAAVVACAAPARGGPVRSPRSSCAWRSMRPSRIARRVCRRDRGSPRCPTRLEFEMNEEVSGRSIDVNRRRTR